MNGYFIFGVAYIVFWVGVGYAEIGQISETCGEPYSWYLPILLLVFLLPAFIAGYYGGKK